MYTLTSKLKLFAIIFMVVGAIGIISGFLTTPSSIKEVKEMLDTNHDDSHNIGKTQNENHKNVIGSHDGNKEEAHDDEAHYEHVLQQMQNRPWAAIYVATFFFFIIVLGVLTFYAIQYASQAGLRGNTIPYTVAC